MATEGYNLLFGEMVEIGPLSPDLPRAGQPYSSEAFKMVLDLVNMFNGVTPAMWTHKAESKKGKAAVAQLPDDQDGTATLNFLEKVVNVARLAVGLPDSAGSLGLDQAVYAYGATGKVHPAAYLASLRFAQELSDHNQLVDFSVVRGKFEEFLVRHKLFINALGHSKGSRTRSLESILQMYRIVLSKTLEGKCTDEEIVSALQADPKLKDLEGPVVEEAEPIRKRFSQSVVRAKIVEEILKNRAICTVCGARLPPSARSKDHVKKQEEGGMGTLENLNFTHPYCNNSRDAIEARKNVLQSSWSKHVVHLSTLAE